MLQVSPRTKIFVSLSPTDMRRGFNGLSAEVTQILKEDPHSGHLFLFRNRRRDRLKVLLWDNDGWVIYYKRLERGTFEFPQPKSGDDSKVEIRASELSMILDGIRLEGRLRRPRYNHESES